MYSLQNFFTKISQKNAILIIILFGAIIYFNGLFNQFIGDDTAQILDNPAVLSLSNIDNFFKGSTFFIGKDSLVGVYYKPLMMTEYTILYSIFGSTAFWFHLFQITLHITNTVLLFLFFLNFFKRPIAFVLSIIFLVHPINSESVLYIAATQEVLFFFFGILALWLLTYFKSTKYLFLSVFLLFLSLLSKEAGILFTIAAFLYILIYQRKRLFSFVGLSSLSLLIYFFLKINAVGLISNSKSTQIALLDLPQRLINAPAIVFFYLKTFLFPMDLAYAYRWAYTQLNFNNFILPLIVDLLFVILILIFAFILFRKANKFYFKTYSFFVLIFLIGLVLHLQIFPLDLTVSERWFYFPIIGALGVIGVLFEYFKINLKNKFLFLMIILIVILLATRTFIRTFDWRNQLVLSYHDIKISKEDYTAENYIATELTKKGNFEEAKKHAARSIDIFPYFTNYNTLGLIYLNQENYRKAEEAFLTGMNYGDYVKLYENLGALAILQEDPNEDSITIIRKSVQKFPRNAKLWAFLAILEYNRGNTEIARKAITQAYKYSQANNIIYVYNKIFNNEPLDVRINTVPK